MFALSRRRALGLAILALSLGSSFSAQAQNAGNAPPPTNWNNEKFERQEFREEMEKIRKEHEDLETARDKLLDQCVNAKDQQAAECEKQKQALHEWRDKLHERMRILHEKMEAARKAHPEPPQ